MLQYLTVTIDDLDHFPVEWQQCELVGQAQHILCSIGQVGRAAVLKIDLVRILVEYRLDTLVCTICAFFFLENLRAQAFFAHFAATHAGDLRAAGQACQP